MYGEVTLQDELTIGSGETLTVPEGAKLACNGNLANNGTILVESGGTVSGNLSGGTEVTTPSITAQPTGQTVTEGTQATFSVTASDAQTYQWQQKTSDSSDWTNISDNATGATYTITNTTTTMNGYQYRCMVKSASGVGVISSAATLTVNTATVSVTGVTLNKNTLQLYTGESETLTATVTPDNATNKAVTWSSDKPEVATVEGGKVTAVGAGTAAITATAEDDSNISAICTVTVTQSEYSISADTTALDFGSVYVGGTQPAAKTVTITNTGNQPLTLTQPASTSSFEVGTLSKTALAAGETATFTVQPKAGLAVGTYSEDITVSSSEGATVTITASFTVKQYSSGGGSSSSSSVSDQTVDKIESAKDGATVEITLKSGQTKLDKEVFEELAGRDVTLQISLPGGVMWTVNGEDIPTDADLTDLDLGVTMDTDGIPASVFNAITGETGTVQLTLAHDGEFGFALTLTAPLGKAYADLWANLYQYDEDAGKLVFQTAARIGADGTVSLPFTHASEYAIVIDDRDHTPKAFPFADVAESDWFYDAVDYAYQNKLMNGTSATTFAPNGTMTRAMLVTILHRQAGEPVVNYAMPFDDVAEGTWYTEAVRWAASESIVTGTSATTFAPDAPVTREQFAAILYRYAQSEGQGFTGAWAFRLDFDDADAVSEYAYEAMCWLTMHGVIEGSGGSLNPQDSATRAEAAAMLMRYLQL